MNTRLKESKTILNNKPHSMVFVLREHSVQYSSLPERKNRFTKINVISTLRSGRYLQAGIASTDGILHFPVVKKKACQYPK